MGCFQGCHTAPFSRLQLDDSASFERTSDSNIGNLPMLWCVVAASVIFLYHCIQYY